ncbi:MAG: hypothetical protein KAI39_10375 [Desulfobulbaceae bacterium]|nr:hypothetical protein [Desulfobulbaceae bacterium]
MFPRFSLAKLAKAAKHEPALASLATLAGADALNNILISPISQWQHDFCLAHGMFNSWCGSCPCSIDDCLISRILDSEGNLDKLRGIEIGQGETADQVIDGWLDSGELVVDIFKNPIWLVFLAESITKKDKKI